MKKTVYQIVTVLMVLMFGAAGTCKLLPQFAADFDYEFRRYVRVPPINMIHPDPAIYRVAVAMTEVVCAVILALEVTVGIQRTLHRTANLVLLAVMTGALYTHFMVNDTPDKWGGAIIGLVLCLLRLWASGYLKVKAS